MKKLVIFLTTEGRMRQCEAASNPLEIDEHWTGSVEPITEYGRRWAKFWPDDIVMLVEEALSERTLA